jgi:UDP-glucuronate 4-epimerase
MIWGCCHLFPPLYGRAIHFLLLQTGATSEGMLTRRIPSHQIKYVNWNLMSCIDIYSHPYTIGLASSKVVLVTGGAGFIGSHVANLLLERGDRVIIVDEMNDYYDIRLKQANLEYLYEKYSDRCSIHRGDICDADFISAIFENERPTHVCHLAARAGVRASIIDPYIYVHSNIEGTTRLLDLARQYACENFVYASSSSVYGSSTKELLSESDVVEKPVSPYAATKKAW